MKKKIIVYILVLFLGKVNVIAQTSWLPDVKDTSKYIRLLECVYNESELKQCKENKQ